jgi:ABC-2 type transport system ATP-binding protein
MSAEIAGLPPKEARRRSSETLFLVGLAEERFRYIGDFSTGMQQRVKLAQAIVHDPRLLLLDEPASGLDPAGREQMLDLIRRLGSFGIDVIVSSHVLTDIEQTCRWVVMLDGGKVLRTGPIGASEETPMVTVEVVERPEAVADRLRQAGATVVVEGRILQVTAATDDLDRLILLAVSESGAGLLRLTRGARSLEELFIGGVEAGDHD